MVNFAFSLIPKGGKNAPSIYPALKELVLIRKNDLTCDQFLAKNFIS